MSTSPARVSVCVGEIGFAALIHLDSTTLTLSGIGPGVDLVGENSL